MKRGRPLGITTLNNVRDLIQATIFLTVSRKIRMGQKILRFILSLIIFIQSPYEMSFALLHSFAESLSTNGLLQAAVVKEGEGAALFSTLTCSKAAEELSDARKSYQKACGELGIGSSLTDCYVQVHVCADYRKSGEPNYKAMGSAKPGDAYYAFLSNIAQDLNSSEDDDDSDTDSSDSKSTDATKETISDLQDDLKSALRSPLKRWYQTKTSSLVSQKIPKKYSSAITNAISEYKCDTLIPINPEKLEKIHDRQEKKADKIQDEIEKVEDTISDLDESIQDAKDSVKSLDEKLLDGKKDYEDGNRQADEMVRDAEHTVESLNLESSGQQIEENRHKREELRALRDEIYNITDRCKASAYEITALFLQNIKSGAVKLSTKHLSNMRWFLKNKYDENYKQCIQTNIGRLESFKSEIKAIEADYQERKSLVTMQVESAARGLKKTYKASSQQKEDNVKQFQGFIDTNIEQKKQALSQVMGLEQQKGSKESEKMGLRFQLQYEKQRVSAIQSKEEESIAQGETSNLEDRKKAIATVLHKPDFTSEIQNVYTSCQCSGTDSTSPENSLLKAQCDMLKADDEAKIILKFSDAKTKKQKDDTTTKRKKENTVNKKKETLKKHENNKK